MTVVEGISTNIVIPCNLVHFTGALYWKINDLIYDLYSVPGFIVDGYSSITLPTASKRMDGYIFQCLALENDNLLQGDTTTLQVIDGTYSTITSEKVHVNSQSEHDSCHTTIYYWLQMSIA